MEIMKKNYKSTYTNTTTSNASSSFIYSNAISRNALTTNFDLNTFRMESELLKTFISDFFNKNQNSKEYVLYFDFLYSQFYLVKQKERNSYQFFKLNKFV
jgi:hypothetical protein